MDRLARFKDASDARQIDILWMKTARARHVNRISRAPGIRMQQNRERFSSALPCALPYEAQPRENFEANTTVWGEMGRF